MQKKQRKARIEDTMEDSKRGDSTFSIGVMEGDWLVCIMRLESGVGDLLWGLSAKVLQKNHLLSEKNMRTEMPGVVKCLA
jgi:hypothetical protein